MKAMNNHHHQTDAFYDQPTMRVPLSNQQQQQQTLHRQPSRQFDAYGQMPTNLYTPDDNMSRYEPSRFDRMRPAMRGDGYGYEVLGAQTWNANAFGGNSSFPAFGATGRMKSASRGRSAIPPTWLDQQQLPALSPYGSVGPSPLGPNLRQDAYINEPDEELIPTAIVIKNIPFAVKKEQLVDLMTHMNLPLPYAFNYHFDNGVFRGLAFANFTSADETAAVIDHLNHFELQGRKLRVEYKKMLPLQERERIEREKREKRGQLEEQHRPIGGSQLHNHPSMSSLASHIPTSSPSPVSSRNIKPDVDLNDPYTLQVYSQILLFKDDHSRETLIFPATLLPDQRRTVHTIAHHLHLDHNSHGERENRQVHVTRPDFHGRSPPMPQVAALRDGENGRRSLNRAATIDFSEARTSEPNGYNTLRGQQSSGFLGIPDSPLGFGIQQNLRGAKSFADLRSYTPSPVPSTASYPLPPTANISRFPDYGMGSMASNTQTITSTVSGSALGQHRDEGLLVNGLGAMSLGSSLGPNSGSPRRLRGMFSWDQDTHPLPTGPIGSNRSFSTNHDDQSRDRGQNLPSRQPRGPVTERSTGFSRGRQNGHQGRGSDELRQSSSVEIIVE